MKNILMLLVATFFLIFFYSCNKKTNGIVDNNGTQNNSDEWINVSGGITTDYVFSLAVKGSYIFAGTNNGLFISNDGTGWIGNSKGLPGGGSQITSIIVCGDNLFVGVYGFGFTNCGVFISNDNGLNWREVNFGLTDSLVTVLAASGNYLFVGTQGGGIFRSTNNGEKWVKANNGLNNLSILSITASQNIIFAATIFGVFRSANYGTNWTIINPDFTFQLSDINPTRLVVSDSTLFAGIYKKNSENGGYLFVSKNNGTSWDSIESDWSGVQISTFYAYGNYIFAGSVGRVFISSNNGTNWGENNTGLPSNTVNALAVTDEYIYAAVQGNGVCRKNFRR